MRSRWIGGSTAGGGIRRAGELVDLVLGMPYLTPGPRRPQVYLTAIAVR